MKRGKFQGGSRNFLKDKNNLGLHFIWYCTLHANIYSICGNSCYSVCGIYTLVHRYVIPYVAFMIFWLLSFRYSKCWIYLQYLSKVVFKLLQTLHLCSTSCILYGIHVRMFIITIFTTSYKSVMHDTPKQNILYKF